MGEQGADGVEEPAEVASCPAAIIQPRGADQFLCEHVRVVARGGDQGAGQVGAGLLVAEPYDLAEDLVGVARVCTTSSGGVVGCALSGYSGLYALDTGEILLRPVWRGNDPL